MDNLNDEEKDVKEKPDHQSSEEALVEFYSNLSQDQEPLSKESEQVLYDNLGSLYVRT